jgi:hypothetical protein
VTTREYNPMPAGLTEADLLAIVEGEALPRERAAVVSKALGAHPALARELEAMKRDRAALRAMGEAPAPAGLLDSVGAALQPVFERQMLLGLAEGEDVHDRPPVSMVVPRGPSIFSVRRLSVAAGIALLAGGAVFTAVSMNGAGPKVKPVGPIANNSPSKVESAPVAPEVPEAVLAKAGHPESGALASRAADEPLYGPMPDEGPAGTLAASESEADCGPPAPAVINAAQALVLANDHRLVIRVIPSDGRFDRITERLAHPRGAWQLSGAAPTELASLLDPRGDQPVPRGAVPDRREIAGEGPGPEAVVLPGPPAPVEFDSLPTVYLLSARMDEATLRALEASLHDTGAEVVFEEATRALPIEGGPVTTPGAVIWWGNGPSGWASWGSVPVVIQR